MKHRVERDSLGDVEVPVDAWFGAQTQRAVNNFQLSGMLMPPQFIRAVAMIKHVAAQANCDLGHISVEFRDAIAAAVERIMRGEIDGGFAYQFPLDVFQTGSGTSTNMNVNEVIAHLADSMQGVSLHPNDHVNYGQSSNDVIPAAITVACALQVNHLLLPALVSLNNALKNKSTQLLDVTKTGRTHLMDAMPLTMAQELGGWGAQVLDAEQGLRNFMPQFQQLALGGTAVGTGVNTDPKFAENCASKLTKLTSIEFTTSDNFFKSISSQDLSLALSGHLKTIGTVLYKIANDLRWMNSGPLAGLAEIELPVLQPGSSIMPGKVNPVIPEAVCMATTQVVANDSAISMAAMSGNFQLNTMLPLIAYNLLQNIELLANCAEHLENKAIKGFTVNMHNIDRSLQANPILVTALNAEIGYETAAKIAKLAYQSKRPILEVAAENTDLSIARLRQLLDPKKLTKP